MLNKGELLNEIMAVVTLTARQIMYQIVNL